MKQLWAPWRIKFLERKEKGCVFCRIQSETTDQDNLVMFRGTSVFVILNRYPYTSGHILAVTNSHIATIEDMDPNSRVEIMELIMKSVKVLRKVYRPDAFNIGTNIGKSAGAGIEGHIHFHIVPRWTGDANFMETLADTKIIPESLQNSYKRIRAEWNSE